MEEKIVKTKILIVDDEHGIVDMIQSYFQKQYDILTAYSGQEALQKIASNPDLILLDINMPKKNGYEVLDEIKADERLKLIPVIVISGSSDPEDVRKSYRHQAAAYVTKSKCLEGMSSLVSAVDSFWFKQALLPEA